RGVVAADPELHLVDAGRRLAVGVGVEGEPVRDVLECVRLEGGPDQGHSLLLSRSRSSPPGHIQPARTPVLVRPYADARPPVRGFSSARTRILLRPYVRTAGNVSRQCQIRRGSRPLPRSRGTCPVRPGRGADGRPRVPARVRSRSQLLQDQLTYPCG